MSDEIRGCNDFELIKYGLKESTLKEKENKEVYGILVFYAVYEFIDAFDYDWLWKVFYEKCTG